MIPENHKTKKKTKSNYLNPTYQPRSTPTNNAQEEFRHITASNLLKHPSQQPLSIKNSAIHECIYKPTQKQKSSRFFDSTSKR